MEDPGLLFYWETEVRTDLPVCFLSVISQGTFVWIRTVEVVATDLVLLLRPPLCSTRNYFVSVVALPYYPFPVDPVLVGRNRRPCFPSRSPCSTRIG